MPAVIHASLDAGDELDVQVQIHTDTLNESGFFEHTMRAIAGRTIHVPLRGRRRRRTRTSSASPARRTSPLLHEPDEPVHAEHVRRAPGHGHGLPPPEPRVPEDVAFAESRIRRETIAAEDVLHDAGRSR